MTNIGETAYAHGSGRESLPPRMFRHMKQVPDSLLAFQHMPGLPQKRSSAPATLMRRLAGPPILIGDPLQRRLQETARRLFASARSARQHGAQPVVPGNDGQPSTILPPEAGRSHTALSGATGTARPPAAGRNLLLRRRRPRTSIPTAELNRLSIATMSTSGRPPLTSSAVDPPNLLQRMGARRLPRLRRKHLQAYLDEFVFRFNRRKPATLLSARSSASPPMQNPLPTAC